MLSLFYLNLWETTVPNFQIARQGLYANRKNSGTAWFSPDGDKFYRHEPGQSKHFLNAFALVLANKLDMYVRTALHQLDSRLVTLLLFYVR